MNRNQAFWVNGAWGANFGVYASYDLAGHIKTETYPSNHTVTYNYDQAGRLTNFTGNLGDGTQRTYSSGITYSSLGGMTREQFGTDTLLYHNWHYNVRGQLYDTRVGSGTDGNGAEWTWNRGALQMYYEPSYTLGASGVNNSGNILMTAQHLPNNDQASSEVVDYQQYSYDSLNRLMSVLETSQPSPGNWTTPYKQSYLYDRWGNRTIDPANTWGGVNAQQFSVTASNNRLGVPGGQSGTMTYDNAGNLTNDSYSGQGQRTYDAENRMTGAQDNYSGWSYYTYDAGGNRVRRKINNQETWQIHGIGGELLAEYAANASPSSPQKEYGYRSGELLVTATSTANDIQWLVSDQLGTPRMIFDKTGSLASTKRHDYLPFGEELFAGIGSRSAALGYGANDSVRQKFTLKERDNETGLDYFLARYYASTQGRFTSVDSFDPILERQQSGDSQAAEKRFRGFIIDPRRWNKYSYVLNNPLDMIDPDGRQGQSLVQRLSEALLPFTPTGSVAQTIAVAVTRTILAEAFGPNIQVRQGGLNAQEFGFAKEVSQFTQNSFVGTAKHQPGIDGILTAPGNSADVRGVASLTETSRGNARVLLDLANDKETSAKNAGNKNVDLFIKANNIDSKTALEFIHRGSGFTNVTSGGTIRSINIFTSDKKVVTISQGGVKTCDTKGKCQ